MSSFEKRQKAFEEKYAREQETRFKIETRACRKLGEWAAEQLEFDSNETDLFVDALIQIKVRPQGISNVIKTIQEKLDDSGIEYSTQDLEKMLDAYKDVVKAKLASNDKQSGPTPAP